MAQGSPVVAPHPLIEYHELLEDVDLAAESAAALSDGQRARRLVFGDRPLCVALPAQTTGNGA